MFKKILMKRGWVRADELPEFVIKKIEYARNEVREQCNIETEKQLHDLEERYRMEMEIEIQDRESKLKFLQQQVDDYKLKFKETEKIYRAAWSQVKANLQVSAESRFQLKKLQDNVQEIFQSILSIGEVAEKQNEKMLIHDTEYRQVLNLPEKMK